jgi:polysaccharide export outer membrane protein
MNRTILRAICGFSLCLVFLLLRPGTAAAQQMAGQSGSNLALASLTANEEGPVSGVPQSPSRLRLGPGDLINVSVFDVPEMAQTLRVSDLGDATMNLIGSVHLAGLTTDEARTSIAKKLQHGNYILDPQVSVFISEYSTQGVSVLGEVSKPGVYPVLGNRSLLDIISAAGGINSTAGASATVKHLDGTMASVKLTKDAKTTLATDFELLPGDKVVVPRAGLIYVFGEVGRPGGFIMENDGGISILQAVAMAGGINHTASISHTRLIRKTANGYSDISVPLNKLLHDGGGDMPLQTEDIVYIPTNVTKAALYRTAPSLVSAASSAAIYRAIP